VITHNRWCEDDSEIFRRHLIHVSDDSAIKVLKKYIPSFRFLLALRGQDGISGTRGSRDAWEEAC
jgi:hypothetical protein